jgi:hypothetical protein
VIRQKTNSAPVTGPAKRGEVEMNLSFFGNPKEASIVSELMQWSEEVLEKSNPYFNDLPPCPYAKQAWLDEKVAVLFKYESSNQVLYRTVSSFDDNFELAIIVDLTVETAPEAFHEYLDDLNTVISEGMFIDKDIWVMGFHPEDDASDFVADIEFDATVEEAYSLIFVQRLSKLQEAADKLSKKGYYDTYDAEYNAREIYAKRENLYRGLKNGDET